MKIPTSALKYFSAIHPSIRPPWCLYSLRELLKLPGLLEVTNNRNRNSQNDSYDNTPILPVFPAMLFDTQGRESIAQVESKITVVSSQRHNWGAFCRCLFVLIGNKNSLSMNKISHIITNISLCLFQESQPVLLLN